MPTPSKRNSSYEYDLGVFKIVKFICSPCKELCKRGGETKNSSVRKMDTERCFLSVFKNIGRKTGTAGKCG